MLHKLLFTCLFFATITFAATFYVAPNGRAANTGSQAAPWSLDHAIATATAGDTVYIKGGVYDFKMRQTRVS